MNLENLVILISGQKRSGKDYVSSIIKEYLEKKNIKTEIKGLADSLKQVISGTFDISLEQLDIYKNNPGEFPILITQEEQTFKQIDFRYLLQRFGTEGVKPVFGDDIWAITLLEKCLKSFNDGTGVILVPDFRFLVEYETFKSERLFDNINCKTIKILNKNITNSDAHISENELNDFAFDFYIDNSERDNKEHILRQLDEIFKQK